MSSIHLARTSPKAHHTKKTVARAARSAPVSRITLKGSKGKNTRSEEESLESFDDDNDMASSFLQFCAMCEKQIVIPNNSVLYCSESCRITDAEIHDNNPSLSLRTSSPTSPIYDIDEPFGFRKLSVTASKLPTVRPLIARIPPDLHDGKQDLDPTEWKPAEGDSNGNPGGGKSSTWRPKLSHQPSSEAYGYLSRFHRSAPSASRRSGMTHRSTPSLSHTPSTATSSDSSLAGTPTEGYLGLHPSTTYVKTTSVKSVDLVTPKLAAISITTRVNDEDTDSTLVDEMNYGKKWVLGRKGSGDGSLKKLLGHAGTETTAIAM